MHSVWKYSIYTKCSELNPDLVTKELGKIITMRIGDWVPS